MDKEQQKDKIIEIVKKAINDNSVTSYGEDDIVTIDGNDVDHIAEEVAENVYEFYHPIDEVAEYKPDEVRRFSDYGHEIRSLKEIGQKFITEKVIDKLLEEYTK